MAASILAEKENTAEIEYINPIEILYKEREYTLSIEREIIRYSTTQQNGIEITKTKEKKYSILKII